LLIPGAFFVLLSSCRTIGDTGVVDPRLESMLLPLEITDRVTTREDTVLALGSPTVQFEGTRLVVHRLVVGKLEKLQPLYSRTDEWLVNDRRLYDLVLVFENNIVSRHSLVKVR
jgi:hypothetical protein